METEKTFEIYKLVNTINNKVYVGGTTEGLGKRWRLHVTRANSGSQYPICQAIREYGSEVFQMSLLEVCDSLEQMNIREQYWIATLSSSNPEFGYNVRPGGGIRFQSEVTKEKIGNLHRDKESEKREAVLQYDVNGVFICEYISLTEAADQTGVSRQAITRSANKELNKPTKSNPYIWVYKKEFETIPYTINMNERFKNLNFKNTLTEKFIEARNSQIKKGNLLLHKSVEFTDNEGNIVKYASLADAARANNVTSKTIRNWINKENSGWKFIESILTEEERKKMTHDLQIKAARSHAKYVYVYDTNLKLFKVFDNKKECAAYFNIDRKTLSDRIKRGNVYGGYIFKDNEISN